MKINEPNEKNGQLYLIRPDNMSLSLWGYDCLLSKYPSNYSSNAQPTPIYHITLENASLGYIALSSGFYRLEVVGKTDVIKVFNIKPGMNTYVFLRIFSETQLSRSELAFVETTKDKALDEILAVPNFLEIPFHSIKVPIQ